MFDHAVETCRRVAGDDLDIGRCLEFMAAELIATYAHLGQREEEHDEENDCSEQPALSDEESAAVEQHICPEGDELPWPIVQNYGKTWNEVLERDDYRCQYPDCGARAQLHVHHIRFRSRSGRKSRAESNSPPNLISICVFHHRSIHAATIGVKGRAPSELEWRRPALMEKVLQRSYGVCAESGGELAREPGPVYLVNGRGRRPAASVKVRCLTIQLRKTPVWKTFSKSESGSKSNNHHTLTLGSSRT